MNPERQQTIIVSSLLLLGLITRLVPHPWNATPVMAIALFGGTYLSRRWSIVLPWSIVALTDLVLGWHNTIPFTWGAMILTGILAWGLRDRATPARVLGGSLASSLLFFVVTNFGVWLVGGLYPRTAAGLWQCYVAAIPFFRGTLLGDLVFTIVLFGGYAAWRQRQRSISSSLDFRPASPS